MMDCKDATALLEQGFDEGVQNSPELIRHLDECQACHAKAQKLNAMREILHALPFEAPEGIEDRVKAVIHRERLGRSSPAFIGLVVVSVFVTASALNWFLPLRELETKVLEYLLAWIPSTEWVGSGRSYREQFEMTWMNGAGMIDSLEWFSTSMLSSALVAAILLMVSLNAMCITQLRGAGR